MIVVVATDEQWNELTASRNYAEWQRATDIADAAQYNNATAFFFLNQDEGPTSFDAEGKPIIINSVIKTLDALQTGKNVYRINGWAGFLKRTVWEIAGQKNEAIEQVFKTTGIKINFVNNEPGFISARVIAMIINEAYFALEDGVSSKTEIDTAMKLGTNYPYGPFEWALQIGTKNIIALLQELYKTDERYKPCQLLITEGLAKK